MYFGPQLIDIAVIRADQVTNHVTIHRQISCPKKEYTKVDKSSYKIPWQFSKKDLVFNKRSVKFALTYSYVKYQTFFCSLCILRRIFLTIFLHLFLCRNSTNIVALYILCRGSWLVKTFESTRTLPKDALLCKVLISFSCQIVEWLEDFSLFIPSM